MAEGFERWRGNMEADYIYSAGVAGDRFLREIRDNERLMGTYCPTCDVLYMPPRLYCENCFTEMTEWEEVPNKGVIETYTVAFVDERGERLEAPVVWAMVRFPGVKGGLLNRVDLPEEDIDIGMEVEAVFKPRGQARGSITDILHFKPI